MSTPSIYNRTVNISGIYSSLEEAFEFCWSSFPDEHKTLPKSTKGNVKLNTFVFGTPWPTDMLCKHYLCHQYGISVTETQTFLHAKGSQRRGARRNGRNWLRRVRKVCSRFKDTRLGFQSPGFRIQGTTIYRIPESGFSYMGWFLAQAVIHSSLEWQEVCGKNNNKKKNT